jgi:hypothetical protein
MTAPGPTPSFRRTSAGTEICPCAVSFDCASAMPYITTVMQGCNASRRLAQTLVFTLNERLIIPNQKPRPRIVVTSSTGPLMVPKWVAASMPYSIGPDA